MKEYVQVVVVIPIGPDCHEGFVRGVIASIASHMTPSRRIILADDSGRDTGRQIQAKAPHLDVVTGAGGRPAKGRRRDTLLRAFAHAAEQYRFDALLRLEPGAVVLAPHPEDDAIRLFRESPGVGMAGPMPRDGQPLTRAAAREEALRRALSHLPTCLAHPGAVVTLRRLFARAEANGYAADANRFGGAYFLSERCIHRLRDAKLLPPAGLHGLELPEEPLVGLLVAAAGMEFGILLPERPAFACAWYGLPTRAARPATPPAETPETTALSPDAAPGTRILPFDIPAVRYPDDPFRAPSSAR